MTAEYKIQTAPVSDAEANGQASELLEGARAKLGFVPNMYRGMAINPGLLSTYLHGYAQFRESGNFTPPEQEVVFLTASVANGCDYCVAAHSMLAVNVSKLSRENTEALREGRPLDDEKLQALRVFTHQMWESRGLPTIQQVEAFKAAGYGDAHLLEIILGLAVKTISNYSNHVNHSELDDVFAAHKVGKAA
ncbi:Carboxymuconolactone decarboxylase family protein [Roseovarius litorisediminis]|uniref:Carboxymuconolactone decarboxylase family protein n=1 Tax=Roseovarius litorisediminis TaxID=1312363 RepID=A0A1Y5RCT2_9RHOB|nr:carboxymuconolactone decarboxylase family protein [Roseovarius litorisediminis]SLN14409.1 Carboxymuconolactone decarboxylase family protein [Roseovarius litorisediminis]